MIYYPVSGFSAPCSALSGNHPSLSLVIAPITGSKYAIETCEVCGATRRMAPYARQPKGILTSGIRYTSSRSASLAGRFPRH
jgi:hypothetical protein